MSKDKELKPTIDEQAQYAMATGKGMMSILNLVKAHYHQLTDALEISLKALPGDEALNEQEMAMVFEIYTLSHGYKRIILNAKEILKLRDKNHQLMIPTNVDKFFLMADKELDCCQRWIKTLATFVMVCKKQ